MSAKKVIFLVDTTNSDGSVYKKHGNMIGKGTVLTFEDIPANVQRLIDIGVATDKDPDSQATQEQSQVDQDTQKPEKKEAPKRKIQAKK